jgi:[ribosomal protein S18]-alanine N-acetyltransferase
VHHFLIRAALIEDIPEIKAVEIACELSPWSLDNYERELKVPGSRMLVAVSESSKVVGFLAGRIVPNYEATVNNIGVLPEIRRAGAGTALLREFVARSQIAEVTRMFLEVRVSNHRAKAFYEEHGFTKLGSRPNFYSNPVEDADVMCLQIGEAR